MYDSELQSNLTINLSLRNSMSMGNKLVQNKIAVFSSLGQPSKFDIILGCDAVCSSSDALNDMFLCLAHCWKHAEGYIS